MKIGQVIKESNASLSFEFFPPKDKAGEDRLLVDMARLEALEPVFVSVTYGAGGGTLKNTKQVIKRIKEETSLNPMPHLTCVDQSRKELKAILEYYRRLGVDNILALRGDPPAGAEKFTPVENGFCYAKDLVKLAHSHGAFSIGVAVYPEGHCESPSLALDMRYTKEKIDTGADFAITQMFFDNRYFYDFIERATKAGITVPILAGIMPIINIDRIRQFAYKCGATIPERLVQRLERSSSPKNNREIGIEVASEQCADLMEHGVRYFHIYTLNQVDVAFQIASNAGLQSLNKQRSTNPV